MSNERAPHRLRAAIKTPLDSRQAKTDLYVSKAAAICTKAAELVGGDRERTHGSKRKNFQNIAELWNAYLAIRPDHDLPLSPLDIGHMMVLLKVARTQLGARNPDDHVDMAGYASCAGEIADGP